MPMDWMTWFIENRAWLFNGVLVALPVALLAWFFRKPVIAHTQQQKGGDGSTNIQSVGSVTIHQGAPLTEVRAMVLDMVDEGWERRRGVWHEKLESALHELLRTFKPSELKHNDLFLSLVAETTAQALRTHQHEKIRALRNVLVNGVLRVDIGEDLKFTLLRTLDDLTPTHLGVLRYLASLADADSTLESYEALYQSFVWDTGQVMSRAHFKLCCDEFGMRKLVHLVGMDDQFDESAGTSPLPKPDLDVRARVVVTEVGRQLIRLLSDPERGPGDEPSRQGSDASSRRP